MIGALILAEGGCKKKGAEEPELFVPMIHVAGQTVIKRQIRTLKKAGIGRIVVASRPEHGILERHLAHLAVSLCFTEEDLVAQGKKLLADCSRIVLVPGNLPLFQPATVTALLEADGEARVAVWQGQKSGLAVFHRRSSVRAADEERKTAGEEERLSEGGQEKPVLVTDPGVVLRLRETADIRRLEEYARKQKDTRELDFQVKLMLRKQEDFFGPGIADFLMRIQETGSMQAACQEMHMSYSKGWKLVNRMEEEMGFSFLIRRNGGRGGGSSTLTREGEAFVRRYYAFVRDVKQMAENFFEQYYGDFL